MKNRIIDGALSLSVLVLIAICLLAVIAPWVFEPLGRKLIQQPLSQKDLEFLALMVQVWGLIATVAFTFMLRRRTWAQGIGPVLMLAVNVISQGTIMGGGPPMAFGFIVFPFYGWFASRATLALSGWLHRKVGSPVPDKPCGPDVDRGEDGA